MTYSRPATSTVGAFTNPARPNDPTAAPRQVVPFSGNGSVRVVDLGGGVNDAAAIKGLFDKILEIGPKVVEDYSVRQANRQVGEFLSNTNTLEAVKRGDEVAMGMVKQLSPRAQDQINTGLAGIAANDYARTFARESALDPQIQEPKGRTETDEQYAERMAASRTKIREKALSESGLMNLPPEYRGKVAIDVQRGEALIMNDIRDQQYKEYNRLYNAQQAGVYGRGLFAAVQRVNVLGGRKPDGTTYSQEEQDREMAKLENLDLDFYNQNIDKATPSQIGAMMFSGFQQQFTRLVASGNYELAQQMVTFQQILMERGISTAAGGNLYEVPVGDSQVRFRDAVAEMYANLKPQIEQAQAKQNFLEIKPLLPAIMAGDQNAMAQLDRMLPAIAQSPEQFGQLMSIRDRVKGVSQEPTPAQQQRMLEYTLAMSDADADVGALNQRIAGDTTLRPDQKMRLMQKETEEKDDVTVSVSRARSYNEPQIRVATENLARSMIARDPTMTPQDAVRQAQNTLVKVATENTEVQIQRLKEAGKPVTADAVNDIFRNELDAVAAGERKRLGQPNTERRTVQQERLQELNTIQQNLQRSQGRIQPSTFPQSVVDAARANGIPTNDARAMTKFFLRRLGATPGPDGKGKMVPDPGQVWRQMLRDSTNTRGGNRQSSAGGPVDRVASLIQQSLGGGAPAPSGGSKAPSRPSQPDVMQVATNLGGRLLTGVLNVIAPPAMAAQGPFPIQNSERMPELARMFRNANTPRPRPMTLNQGPLPQVAAMTPVIPVPLAITNDRHPFFVAIGINEGTRTANGGYTKAYYGHTDPGDGNKNVGTVSGGGARGGGGSPQAVDRRWAGKLTQAATQAAPLLIAAGLPRNTAGFNRVMFNFLDLNVQAPAAARDFIRKIPQMRQSGFTIESIAKARTDSFYYPDGRWGGVWPYPRMLQDQRSRAGTFDYKKRI